MFVLPALIRPLVFGLAIHRLYQIPRRLWLGELQLPGRQSVCLSTVTVAAYLALLSCTIALGAAVVQALSIAENRSSAHLSLVVYLAAYPLVYVAAAWIFYYGLKSKAALGH